MVVFGNCSYKHEPGDAEKRTLVVPRSAGTIVHMVSPKIFEVQGEVDTALIIIDTYLVIKMPSFSPQLRSYLLGWQTLNFQDQQFPTSASHIHKCKTLCPPAYE